MNTLPDLSQLTHEQLLEFTGSWQCSISLWHNQIKN